MFPFLKPKSKFKKLKRRYKKVDGSTVIDMVVKNADHLFDGRDPAPFREKDLDEDAADYITTSLQEIDESEDVKIRIFVTNPRGFQDRELIINDAVHTYFAYEAKMKRRERDHILKMAFKSLLVGLTILSISLYATQILEPMESFLAKFVSEGLHIFGWYSMWKPIYFGLYEWWPTKEEELLLQRAASLDVEVINASAQNPGILQDAQGMEPSSLDEPALQFQPMFK